MKTYILIIALISLNPKLFGQNFPSPQNFQIEACYNSNNDCGIEYSEYDTINHYTFDVPNLENTDSELIGYNLYLNDVVIEQLDTNDFTDLCPGMGSCYVTALYTNPDGESAPSNSCESTYLLSIDDFDEPEIQIYPIPINNKNLQIVMPEKMISCQLFDASGKLILTTSHSNINFQSIKKGIYHLKIKTENGVYFKTLMN